MCTAGVALGRTRGRPIKGELGAGEHHDALRVVRRPRGVAGVGRNQLDGKSVALKNSGSCSDILTSFRAFFPVRRDSNLRHDRNVSAVYQVSVFVAAVERGKRSGTRYLAVVLHAKHVADLKALMV